MHGSGPCMTKLKAQRSRRRPTSAGRLFHEFDAVRDGLYVVGDGLQGFVVAPVANRNETRLSQRRDQYQGDIGLALRLRAGKVDLEPIRSIEMSPRGALRLWSDDDAAFGELLMAAAPAPSASGAETNSKMRRTAPSRPTASTPFDATVGRQESGISAVATG